MKSLGDDICLFGRARHVSILGDAPAQIISDLIGDETTIGIVNHKTTAVRVIPVPSNAPGYWVEFADLLGDALIMKVSRLSSRSFIDRGERIPKPLNSFKN